MAARTPVDEYIVRMKRAGIPWYMRASRLLTLDCLNLEGKVLFVADVFPDFLEYYDGYCRETDRAVTESLKRQQAVAAAANNAASSEWDSDID